MTFPEIPTQKESIEKEIEKLGEPWNRPVNVLDTNAMEQIKKAGQDARLLQALKEKLAEL